MKTKKSVTKKPERKSWLGVRNGTGQMGKLKKQWKEEWRTSDEPK